jgi:hypothetical protein
LALHCKRCGGTPRATGRAHALAQSDEGADCALVHAYLHRKEGDAGNAAYWYRRARSEPADDSLEAEWRRIVETLLPRQRA